MSKRAGFALFLAMAALFLILNRDAYRGYFQDDDLDTLGWATYIPSAAFLKGLVTPRFQASNFRPAGHFYYHVLGREFYLDFPKYILPLHLAHLLNVWLLWMLARKLGLGPVASSVGSFFFGFHVALFDVFWKPMYVFDLLCTTFCLTSLLLYLYDRWVLSFVAFWLAYKSKELAVMLPAVLACYELWLGTRRWKRLIPFFAVSLLFGVQGLAANLARDDPYRFRFTIRGVQQTIGFYSSQIFLLRYAGLALLALPLLVRDRRVWFGLAAMCLFLAPLVLLPGRIFAPYWCLPLTGAAIALASLATRRYAAVIAVLLALWIPWSLIRFRQLRRETLAQAEEDRAYVAELARFARTAPDQRTFVYDGVPAGFHSWGVSGALSCVYRAPGQQVVWTDDPSAPEKLRGGAVLLHWDASKHKAGVITRTPGEKAPSYLVIEELTSRWQLGSGWHGLNGNFRWTLPDATALLRRPPRAQEFELVAGVAGFQIDAHRNIELEVLLNGQPIGRHTFTAAGDETLRWKLPAAPPGDTTVEFHVRPPYVGSKQDPTIFGMMVRAFGFVPE